MRYRWRLTTISLMLALVANTTPALAAEWLFSPIVLHQVIVDDNRRLRRDQEETLVGHLFRLRPNLRYRTERTTVRLRPLLRFERWWGDQTFDTDDQEFLVEAQHTAERLQFGLNAGIVRDTTLSSEFSAVDSVRISERRRRETLNAAPYLTYQLDPRTALSVNASALKTIFPHSGGTALVDYSYTNLGASLRRSWTERLTLSTNVSASRFLAGELEARTDSLGAGVGAEYRWSPDWTVSASGEVRTNHIRSVLIPEPAREQTFVTSASISRAYERGSFTATLSRSSSPTSSGFLIERAALDAEWTHKFKTHLVGIFELSYSDDASLGEIDTAEDQERLRFLARLRLHLSPKWMLVGRYRYVRREIGNQSIPADSNAISLVIRYRPNPKQLLW